MLFRKAILLVHGFAGGIYDYGKLGNTLQLNWDFDVYTFTLPGHEKMIISDVTRDDWVKAAEDQIETLIAHGYKTIYVVGHSMGGVIACHLARNYPQVKKLILAAPSFKYLSFDGNKLDIIESLKKTPEIFKEYKFEKVISRITKMPIPTIIEFVKLVEEHHDDPKHITCPTLIIQGLDDAIVPMDSALYVYENIKATTKMLMKMENVTHDVFVGERNSQVINIISDFLKRKHFIEKKEIKEM